MVWHRNYIPLKLERRGDPIFASFLESLAHKEKIKLFLRDERFETTALIAEFFTFHEPIFNATFIFFSILPDRSLSLILSFCDSLFLLPSPPFPLRQPSALIWRRGRFFPSAAPVNLCSVGGWGPLFLMHTVFQIKLGLSFRREDLGESNLYFCSLFLVEQCHASTKFSPA